MTLLEEPSHVICAEEFSHRRERLIQDVNKGIEQLERGEGTPLNIEKLKSAVRERLDAR